MANTSGSLGNIMSRLGGIKSVSGRRVMPKAPFLDNLESPDTDMGGTAQPQSLPEFSNFMPPKQENIPQEELGGELTSQSYDVRANSVNPPEEENGNPLKRFGRALWDYVNPQKREEMSVLNSNNASMARNQASQAFPQTPPIETAQVDMQEGLPPVTASEEEASPGILQSLKSEATKPYGGESLGNLWEGTKNIFKEGLTPGISPETYEKNPYLKKPPELVQQQQQQKELDQQQMNAAQMEPWQVTAYGATDAFANQPELVKDFETYTGINFDDEQKEMTNRYEKVLSDIEKGYTDNEAGYDEQERRISERIKNNQSTDADKFYIGMALLMPLIVGGLFGKEAGFGALSGSAKGYADVLGRREKNLREDEELLGDIHKQRSSNAIKQGELEIEKMKVPAEVKKNMPKDEYEDLKGTDIYTFKDPTTGKVVAEGAHVLPDLYLDLKYGNTPKKREQMQEKASKLEEEKASLERANAATSDVIKAAMQLKDPSIMSSILAYALSEDKNGALKKIVRQNAPKIMVDGRKQNSAVYIDSKIELIKDAYRRNEQMKAFTETVSNHIGQMAENPQYSGLKPEDLIDQVLNLRDRAQGFFVDRASSQGFLKQPLENKFGKMNRELYKVLNQKEEKKELERDKQLMYGSA